MVGGRVLRAQPVGQIAGIVIDAAGQPIAGVMVTLAGEPERRIETLADGRFVIDDLDDGLYLVEAALDGFDPVKRPVRVVGGRAEAVRLVLSLRTVEQVTVTAARTSERDVQTVPISVSVLTRNELEHTDARTVADFAGAVPSVTLTQNAGFAQLTMRGIGSFQSSPGSDPSSVVYLDGVYLGRPAAVLADFLDVERVEVLRGPQGTLYGRNAVGGALNVVTRPPSAHLEIAERLSAGTLHFARSETRVSGSLVPERITATLDVLRGVSRGFVDDLNHPDNPLGGTDVTAARGAVRLVLGRAVDLLLATDVNHQHAPPLTDAKVLSVKPGFVVDDPSEFHAVRSSTPAMGTDVQSGSSARLEWRPTPALTISSLTAVRSLRHHALVDTDITELPLTVSDIDETYRQRSEEVTVSGRHSRAVWTGGLFLFGETSRQPRVVQSLASNTEAHFNPTVEGRSSALFGDMNVTLTPSLSVGAGVRYSRERKTIDNSGFSESIDAPRAVVPGSPYQYGDGTFSTAWTPRLSVSARTASGTLVYASAARGFKSGGFNVSVKEPGHAFAPETAWSYEVGVKSLVWGKRAVVDVAGFYTDYRDLQVQVGIRPGVSDISNAAAATIVGFEAEERAQLPSGWSVGGHLSWLDATYDRYVALSAAGATFDAAGHRLSNTPAWSGRTWIEREVPFARGAALSARADVRWQTTVYFSPENDAILRQAAYGLLDGDVTVRPAARPWSIGMFVRNVLNTDYITTAFSGPLPAYGGQPGEPRQVGVRLNVDFVSGR